MNKEGALFLNGDDPMLEEIKDSTGVKTFCYGTKDWCDYRAENIHMENYQYVYDYVYAHVCNHQSTYGDTKPLAAKL
jgi:UDP-N-acetylmuramoyl-tripeptide--D-alanyl-D-alanine ligase